MDSSTLSMQDDFESMLNRNDNIYKIENKKKCINNKIQKAKKNANLSDLFDMISKLVSMTLEEEFNVKFIPDEHSANLINPNEETHENYITFKVKSRKPRSELKPRHREEIIDKEPGKDRKGIIYGQLFDCYVLFTVYSYDYKIADIIMDKFEDMIFSYKGYIKDNGIAEMLFKEQLEDDTETIVKEQKFSNRRLLYYVEIEKLTVIFRETIEKVISNLS